MEHTDRFLLVLVGIGNDGGDRPYIVSESSFTAAMFANVYECPVLAYVWCETHRDWIRCDESGICDKCLNTYLDSLGQNESEDCYGWDDEDNMLDDDVQRCPRGWTVAEMEDGNVPF